MQFQREACIIFYLRLRVIWTVWMTFTRGQRMSYKNIVIIMMLETKIECVVF